MGYRPPKREEENKPGTVVKILDYLNRPSAAVIGGLKGLQDENIDVLPRMWENFTGKVRDRGKDLLPEEFSKTLLGNMAGGAIEVATDPLNALAIGPVRKAIGVAANPITRRLPAAKEAFKASKIGGDITNSIREKIAPTFLMPEEIARTVRLSQAAHRSAPERVLRETMETGLAGKGPWKGEATFDSLGFDDQVELLKKYYQTTKRVVDPKTGKVRIERDILDPAVASTPERLANVTKEFVSDKLRGKIGQRQAEDKLQILMDFIQNPANKKHISQIPQKGFTSIAELQKSASPLKGLPLDKLKQLSWAHMPEELLKNLAPTALPHRSSLGKGYDTLLDTWRSGVTKWNLPFHVTNDIGNKYNILADTGMNPFKVKASGKAFRKGTLRDPQDFLHSREEIEEALKKFDVDQGLQQHVTYRGDDIDTTLKSVRESIYGKSPDRNIFTKVREGVGDKIDKYLGDPIERNPRVGVAVETLRKLTPQISKRADELVAMGASKEDALRFAKQEMLEKAVIQTKDTMFDYRELTPFEQGIKRAFIPFYTFSRKNAPLQARSILSRPYVPAHAGKVRDTLNSASEDAGVKVPNNLVPDWLDEGAQLPIPKNWSEDPVFLRNKLPLMDLAYLAPFEKETRKQIGNLLGPLPKTATEILMDVNFSNPRKALTDQRGFFGTKVPAPESLQSIPSSIGSLFMNEYKDPVDPKMTRYEVPLPVQMLLRDIPLVGQYGRAARGAADLFGGDVETRDPLAFLNMATGLPVTAQNRKYLERTAKAREIESRKQPGVEKKQESRRVKRKSFISRILEDLK